LREGDAESGRFDALDFAVVVTDRELHETAVNTATGCDRILTVQIGDQGLHLYELRLTTLSWFDLVSGPPRKRLDWSALVAQLNEEAGAEGGTWVSDELSEPLPSVAFWDAEFDLAPNGTRPEAVKRIMAGFFTQGPHLPAGM